MPDNKNCPAIPVKVKKEYRLTSLLSLHQNAIVFSLEKKKNSTKNTSYAVHPDPFQGVIKMMPKSYFDETLFTVLQSLHHPLLLLPTELFTEGDYVYAIYPKLLPFPEYLSGERISLSAIQQWIKDMSQILSCLHSRNIVHGDIAPGNIYLDNEGHFYLGDFSSCRLLPSRRTVGFIHKKNKTGTTFPFSSMEDHRQDIFSFLTILSNLLEAALPAEEDSSAVLSALRNSTDTLLLELRDKKHFALSFRQVCQKILSVIEEDQKKMKASHYDFLLSCEKLGFLRETTRTLKNNTISSPFLCQPKIFLPVIALALCILIFLSAITYYIGSGRPQQKESLLANISPTANSTAVTSTESVDGSDASEIDHQSNSILDISCKKYQNIPSSPRADPSVKIIFAQGNQFKKLCLFSGYPALEELYLDGNIISDLSDLSAFQHLSILGLSNNELTDLSSLESLSSLRILDLSGHSKLTNFSSLKKLKNLEYLILTGTNATDNTVQRLQQSLPHCTILY